MARNFWPIQVSQRGTFWDVVPPDRHQRMLAALEAKRASKARNSSGRGFAAYAAWEARQQDSGWGDHSLVERGRPDSGEGQVGGILVSGDRGDSGHYSGSGEGEMAKDKGGTEVINDFLVGCDPEFVLLDSKGQVFNTAHLWEQDGPIGWDHNGRVQELRPEPTKGTYALLRRIQTLVMDKKLEGSFRRRAGARVGNESLGGHVHFGFSCAPKISYSTTDPFQSAKVTYPEGHAKRLRALDAVTYLLEHLDILPLQECTNRRKGNYGKWGDFRDSNGHTEYRTMASWLYDPKVAYACLTAAKLAASDPEGTADSLKGVTSFKGLENWVAKYKGKDTNARRLLELLAKGHKPLQIDPDVDFRGRWERLGI